MAVDVVARNRIAAPIEHVASFACDPDNAPRWYANIHSIVWETAPPLAVGSRMKFVAHFLGRRLEYTYEVVEYAPGQCLRMRTAQGPFPMETTYRFASVAGGETEMELRNQGEPSGFSKVVAPMMTAAMRRANEKDLAALKALVESGER